ncbi:MAG: hypothetical protein MJ100_09870 [Ruminococcus sp.]|nr:hypothetical protein [Ruminococcus sp.]
MTIDNFLSYLQQILTMVDKNDEESVSQALNALVSVGKLVEYSGKADLMTRCSIQYAIDIFDSLAEEAEDYAGKPGASVINVQRRKRLKMAICPCL